MVWARKGQCSEREVEQPGGVHRGRTLRVVDLFRGKQPDPKWRGRGQGVDVVSRSVLPQKACGIQGKLNQEEYGSVWLLSRWQELACIAQRAAKGAELSQGCMAQWNTLVRKVCSPSAPSALRQEKMIESLSVTLQDCLQEPARAAEKLVIGVNWIKAVVRRGQVKREKESKVAWTKWRKQQEKEGGEGGMLFSFVKRTTEDPEVATRCMGRPSLMVEEVVLADFKQWDTLWQKLKDVAYAPWRTERGSKGRSRGDGKEAGPRVSQEGRKDL